MNNERILSSMRTAGINISEDELQKHIENNEQNYGHLKDAVSDVVKLRFQAEVERIIDLAMEVSDGSSMQNTMVVATVTTRLLHMSLGLCDVAINKMTNGKAKALILELIEHYPFEEYENDTESV
jgi:hypothetical protein